MDFVECVGHSSTCFKVICQSDMCSSVAELDPWQYCTSTTGIVILLTCQEFEMDSKIKKQLIAQKNEKIAAVEKEMAWEEAKHDLALKKLQSR